MHTDSGHLAVTWMARMASVCCYRESRHSFGLNTSARMSAMRWLANPRDETMGGSNRCISVFHRQRISQLRHIAFIKCLCLSHQRNHLHT